MSHKQRKFVGESPVKLTFMIKQRALFFSATLSLLMMCDRTQMDKKNENQNLIQLLRVKEGSKYNYTKWWKNLKDEIRLESKGSEGQFP